MKGSAENEKDETTIAGGLCATALVVGMMPGAIWASDAVTYLYMGELKICESATLVTAEDTVWGANDGAEHWLVAEGDVTIDGRVAVAGDVSLILADGAMLVVDGGIDVPAGAGFTIYAQSDGDNQGILEAYGEEFSGEGSAGIGGNEEDVNFGDIVICGGLIYAEGGSRAAGIGGGGLYLNDDVVDGAVSIVDGDVYALGGQYAAGIGSGGVGTPCAITITGGTIAATGGVQADDIGNGYDTTGSSFTTGENGHALITAETVLGGSVTVVPFVDVQPDDWYIDVVKYALENGLMTGVSETEFAPDLATTRGMVASVLYRLEGGPEAEDAGFSDVSADAWYADAVNWAANVGVVAGYGDAFGANDAITREQLAAILCNYAAYKGEDVSSGAALDGYSDAASVSDWAGESVEWAVAEGLLSGVTNDELAPQGSATRAQVAAMLQRFNARQEGGGSRCADGLVDSSAGRRLPFFC